MLDLVGLEAPGCAVGDGLDGVAAIERRGGGGEAVVASETSVEAAPFIVAERPGAGLTEAAAERTQVEAGAGKRRLPFPSDLVQVLGLLGGSASLCDGLASFGTGDAEVVGDGVDLVSAAAQGLDRGPGYAVDFGDTASDAPPADPESTGELVLEGSACEVRGGLGVREQGAGIERTMSAGAGLEEVGEHDVGVELWVEVPRGGMGEGARGEALAADALGAASAKPHWASRYSKPERTARSTAAVISARVGASALAHRMETDLGAEKVMSKPMTTLAGRRWDW